MASNKHQQRDLLVLLNNEFRSRSAIEQEVEWLHDVLFHVESIENFCIAHELIHVNKNKVYQEHHKIRREVQRKKETPFVFLNNKN